MSLSLLNAYNSSDESDDDEGGSAAKPKIPDQTMPKSVAEPQDQEDSKERRNFFEADPSDSEEEDADEVAELQADIPANSGFIGPTIMPYTYDVPAGPAHPSQMYNYAAYADSYGEPSSSTGTEEPDDDDEPSAKRHRGLLTDEDAKKLIKKLEADSLGLAMPDQLEIIDAHVDSHLGNVRENLVKNITTIPTAQAAAAALQAAQGGQDDAKGKRGKKGKDGAPGGVAKRKHQITYLAYLAKANEEKLQNEWAKNRLTKRQTQAKYGF